MQTQVASELEESQQLEDGNIERGYENKLKRNNGVVNEYDLANEDTWEVSDEIELSQSQSQQQLLESESGGIGSGGSVAISGGRLYSVAFSATGSSKLRNQIEKNLKITNRDRETLTKIDEALAPFGDSDGSEEDKETAAVKVKLLESECDFEVSEGEIEVLHELELEQQQR
jgi:hypothetical protein